MKAHLLMAGMLAVSVSAYAAVLSPQQALQRALDGEHPSKVKNLNAASPQLKRTVSAGAEAACYVFDTGQGYAVVSADDCAPALLGYSDSGAFDQGEIPPALNYWLESYARQIEYARSIGSAPMSQNAPESTADFPPIEPLTATRWNQNAPYNDLCPIDNGSRSVTGCVATALAQIMKYHSYPAKGQGSNSYSTAGQTLTVDFGSTEYKWDDMLDIYNSSATKEQNAAVATLMYSCGVAVNMEYTSVESSASSLSVPTAMVKHFGYDKGIRYIGRDYYGLSEWQGIVYEQLRDYGPVQYSGQSSEGGHSFVCDGYSGNGYFHINWGWGGMSDGYFLLTALDPLTQGIGGSTSGFNYDQDIIANVSKPREGSRIYEQMAFEENFEMATQQAQLGGNANVNGPVYNLSIEAISGTMGLKFENADGEVAYAKGSTFSDMPQLEGYNAYQVTLPSDLAEGTYTVTPGFFDSDNNWHDALIPISGIRSAEATVSGATVTFTANAAPKLTFSDVNTSVTPFYVGSKFEIKANLSNESASEYYGSIVAALVDDSGNVEVYGDNYPVDLMPGDSIAMSYVSAFSHMPQSQNSWSQQTPQPGGYTLYFMSADLSNVLSEGYPVTLQAKVQTEIEVASLQLDGGGSVVADKSDLKATADLQCVSGYFANSLTLAIFDSSANRSIAAFSSDVVFVTEGNTAQVHFHGDFAAAQAGVEYMALVFDGQTQLSREPLVFTVQDQSGIRSTIADEGTSVYYTLRGVAIAGEPESGTVCIKATTMPDGTVTSTKVVYFR